MGSWSDGSALIAGEKAAESGRSSGQSGDAARSSPCDIVLLPLPAMCISLRYSCDNVKLRSAYTAQRGGSGARAACTGRCRSSGGDDTRCGAECQMVNSSIEDEMKTAIGSWSSLQ